MVEVAAMAQIQAATMQMQVCPRHRHGEPAQLRLGVPEAAAIPGRAGPKVRDGHRSCRRSCWGERLGRGWQLQRAIADPKVLEAGVNAAAAPIGALAFAHRDGTVAAPLPHAQLGGHGVHQALPLTHQAKPVNGHLG